MAKRYTPMDDLLKFAEDLTLAASDVVQRDSADVILKIGKGRYDMALVIDVETIEIASNDELYDFLLQGAPTTSFSAGAVENLGHLQLGATEVRVGGAKDSVAGRYIIPLSNDLISEYEYVRLNVIIAGAIATGVKFSAWLTQALEP